MAKTNHSKSTTAIVGLLRRQIAQNVDQLTALDHLLDRSAHFQDVVCEQASAELGTVGFRLAKVSRLLTQKSSERPPEES